ncbi:MAG: DUF4388 domain-containing protein [Deltaproteobacteria bacterium]|nr:DUF4388 domain-containing protein [Deltaproteobacteria bacterium]
MIWFRDGIAWAASIAELASQRENIGHGVLMVQLQAGVEPPAQNSHLRVELIAEQHRIGPFDALVLRCENAHLYLELPSPIRPKIAELVAPRLRSATSELAAIAATPKEARERRLTTGAHRALAIGSLTGQLAGTLGLGLLGELFDETPVAKPPVRCSLLQLFAFLAQQRATGSLAIRSANYTKRIGLRSGTPVSVLVTPIKEDEQLGQLLLKARLISPQKLGEVTRRAAKTRVSIGAALVESGVIEEDQLGKALTHQAFRRLEDLFYWTDATYDFTPAEQVTEGAQQPIPLPRLRQELASSLLRRSRLADLQVVLESHNEQYVALRPGSGEDLKRLILQRRTLDVCQKIFDGERTLRQALTASILGRPKTVQLVLYLEAAGVLEFHSDALTEPTRETISERLRNITALNAFQRLGLPYTVHASEIEAAHRRRQAPYKPGGKIHEIDTVAATRILALFDEARDRLIVQNNRVRYRNHLLGSEKLALLATLVEQRREYALLTEKRKLAEQLDQIASELRAS